MAAISRIEIAETRSIFGKVTGLISESLPEGVFMTTGDSMPERTIRVAKIQAIRNPDHPAETRDFIGVLRNPPKFTERPKNNFSERLTNPIFLVYSQMARG